MPFVVHEDRPLLFVHIPKTGGTSIEDWMRRFGPLHMWAPSQAPAPLLCTPQHLRSNDLAQLFAPGFFAAAFTIVRNPFTRIQSEYRMRHLLNAATGMPFPSFGRWLEAALDQAARNPFHLDNHLRPQWQFVGHGTTVFRYEDGLERAIETIGAPLGMSLGEPLPHTLSSAAFAGEITWDKTDIVRVRERYREDFSEFGYDPDGPPA